MRRSKDEKRKTEEEENVGVEAVEERLVVVMTGTEEEATERLEAALDMEVYR